jgi:hypothetical protein
MQAPVLGLGTGESRRSTKLAAHDNVDTLIDWVPAQLGDETIFPNKIDELWLMSRPAQLSFVASC